MILLGFIFLSMTNISVLILLIRKRGWASSEGLCACFLLAVVISDNLEVCLKAYFWPETLLLGADEINLRIYPTIVHILGIGVLLLGLTIADPRPGTTSRTLSPNDKRTLTHIAVALVLIGAAMHAVAVYRVGGSPFSIHALDAYRTDLHPDYAFLVRGADIALLGLALLFATLRGFSRGMVAVAIVLTPLLALTNKGGLEKGLLWAAIALYIYRNREFRKLFRAYSTWVIGVPAVLVTVMLAIGIKDYYRGGAEAVLVSEALQDGLDKVRGRYSEDGLYRGYSQMATYMHIGSVAHFNGRVLAYTLTAWIPGFIFTNKPDHPTRNTGFMIYSDHHSYPGDASAFTLVGLAYADFGVTSVVCYLIVGGLVLGLIRRTTTRAGGSLYYHIGYLFLCLFGACSHESGFMDIIYVSVFVAAVMGLAWLIVHFIFGERRSGRHGTGPATVYEGALIRPTLSLVYGRQRRSKIPH
jgi:hypothetical protein